MTNIEETNTSHTLKTAPRNMYQDSSLQIQGGNIRYQKFNIWWSHMSEQFLGAEQWKVEEI